MIVMCFLVHQDPSGKWKRYIFDKSDEEQYSFLLGETLKMIEDHIMVDGNTFYMLSKDTINSARLYTNDRKFHMICILMYLNKIYRN